MLQGKEVSVEAADQGLQEILEAAQCQDAVQLYLKETCGMATTSDLISYFGKATYEQEVTELLKAKFPVADGFPIETQRLYITRVRAAYRIATEVGDRVASKAAAPPEEQSSDLERPLDSKTVEQLDKRWDAVHPFKFISQMRPSPPFRNRIFREIQARTCKLVPVEKVRSVHDHKTTHEPTALPVGGSQPDGGRLVFEVAKKTNRHIANVVEYLAALQILMRTYAYCGSHQVPSSGAALLVQGTPKTVTYFSYGAALQYVDEVTAAVMAIGLPNEHDRLIWLRRRDEQIRTEMVANMNEGTPGDEALATAWSKFKHVWIMRDSASAVPQTDALAVWEPPRGQVRQRDEAGGKGGGKEKRQKGGQQQQTQEHPPKTANITRNRIKLCGAFNAKKGCVAKERQCPQRARRWCSLILADGTICEGKDHGAPDHFKLRGSR